MNSILRQTRKRWIYWALIDLVATTVGLVGLTVVLAVVLESLPLSADGRHAVMFCWWIVALSALVWRIGLFAVALLNTRSLLRKLESTHPEYRDELSTLAYLDAHTAEADHLGFSPSLIAALREEVDHLPPPQWARLGLSTAARRGVLLLGGAGAAALIGFLVVAPNLVKDLTRAHLYGEAIPQRGAGFPIDVPAVVEVPANRELVITAEGEREFMNIAFEGSAFEKGVAVLVRRDRDGWATAGKLTRTEAGGEVSLKVDRPIDICFSTESGMSAPCRIEPVYPPVVRAVEAHITPPAYTGRPSVTVKEAARVEALQGSAIEIAFFTHGPVTASTLEILSPTQSVVGSHSLALDSTESFRHRLTLEDHLRLRAVMVDRFGQRGMSSPLQFNALPDALPEVEILSPTRESVLPDNLLVPIAVSARDDIGVASMELVFRLENGFPSAVASRVPIELESLEAGEVGTASAFLAETALDLTTLDLWPGDRVAFWVEVHDIRGDAPSKTGISPTHYVRYPSVEENLDDLASNRERSIGGIQDLLEEQKQINRQFEEIRKDLQRNRANLSDPDKQIDAQRKLSDTIQREQDFQQKLEETAQQLDETLQRLSEDDQQALTTLHKFQRVQDLMDELLTDESKKILRELQETLKELQKGDIRPDELDQTEESLAEFEKQLDRQLALLENLWIEKEVEALRDAAEELAERQEELRQSTMDQLTEEEKSEVAQAETEREAGIAEPDEKVEEKLDEMIDRLEEAIAEKESATGETKTAETPTTEASSEESKSEESAAEQTETAESESQEGETAEQSAKEEEAAASEEEAASEPQTAKGESEPEGLKQEETAEASQPESSPEEGGSPESSPPDQNQVLAERQEQLNRETERLLDELKRLTEKANEKEHQLAERLNQMDQGEMCDSIQESQKSAQSQLQQNEMKQAAKSQSQAGKQMQSLAQSLGECCSGSGQDMEQLLARMREVLDRAFLLSEQGEGTDGSLSRYKGLSEWPNVDRMSRMGTEMGWYRQEVARLSKEFQDLSKENPFADFEVVRRFDFAERSWSENVRAMEEDAPLSVSLRSHQALGSLNLAIEKLIDSIDETSNQSQNASNGLEGYFQGIKKMLSQQKGVNEQTEALKQQMAGKKPGEETPGGTEGEGLSPQEQMQKIAEQQAATRRQLEALEEKYQGIKQKAGSLGGVGDQMEQVEKDLEQGILNDRVTDLQENIVQRLLDAEKSIHNQGYKEKRRALRTDGVLVEEETAPTLPDLLEEGDRSDLARLLKRDLDRVSPHWRERVRAYYDNLLQP